MAGSAQSPLPIPDEELVRRFQHTHAPEHFSELFARHRKRVYLACRAFHGESGAAEDATQETFVRVYEKIGQFTGGDFGGWLMKVARNICIDGWRKRRPEAELVETELGETGIEGIALPDRDDSRLSAAQVWHEMKALPPEQRRCLELKIEGYSYDETAARTGFTVEAVKSHLQNGRRMLWMRLEGTGAQSK